MVKRLNERLGELATARKISIAPIIVEGEDHGSSSALMVVKEQNVQTALAGLKMQFNYRRITAFEADETDKEIANARAAGKRAADVVRLNAGELK